MDGFVLYRAGSDITSQVITQMQVNVDVNSELNPVIRLLRMGRMERLLVQTLLSGNWCPSRLSIRTGSVLTVH